MADFTVRVELHKPLPSDAYANLHKAMKEIGFDRTIVVDGIKVQLPPAEYYGAKKLNVSSALILVEVIVKQIHSNYAITVHEFIARETAGLDPA